MSMMDDYYLNSPNPFLETLREGPKVEEQGIKRYGKLLAKGATLGLLGGDVTAETIPEHVTEFVGGVAPIALTGGTVGAAMQAGRLGTTLARLGPLASRAISAGAGGTVYGGAKAAIEGKEPLDIAQEAITEGAIWGGMEGALVKGAQLLKKFREVKPKTVPETPSSIKTTDEILTGVSPENIQADTRVAAAEEMFTGLRDPYIPSIAEYGPVITRVEPKVLALPEKAYLRELAPDTGKLLSEETQYYAGIVQERTMLNDFIEGMIDEKNMLSKQARMDSLRKSGGGWAALKQEIGPNGERIISPLTREADEAAQMVAESPIKRDVGTQFTPEQVTHLISPENKATLEAPALAREAQSTTNLLAKTDDDLAEALKIEIVAPGELVAIQPGSGDMAIRAFLRKNNITDDEFAVINTMAKAAGETFQADLKKLGVEATEDMVKKRRFDIVQAELRKRCP